MPHALLRTLRIAVFLAATTVTIPLRGADEAPATNEPPVFVDPQLEAAVRQQVFAKRNTTNALTAGDVAQVSVVVGNFRGITNLAGLEHCKAIASLELAGNGITDLSPLQSLRQLQLLILSSNRISDVGPLGTVPALQYIELSHNQVKDIGPLATLTNLASVYLGDNQLTSIAALTHLPRLVTLYAERNSLKSIDGLEGLKGLSSVSLSGNQIADVTPLTGLRAPSFLFLEKNRIQDLAPLEAWITNDLASARNFAPYLQLFLKDNPLSSGSKKLAQQWAKDGVRVNP
ncbi:MAG: leucine-rich repeat domain-containing protein [Verrucomicrobiae bacterium]|nr:leucine-rich repeat domain-containing protein [Verrucomicrobiae bacterium]